MCLCLILWTLNVVLSLYHKIFWFMAAAVNIKHMYQYNYYQNIHKNPIHTNYLKTHHFLSNLLFYLSDNPFISLKINYQMIFDDINFNLYILMGKISVYFSHFMPKVNIYKYVRFSHMAGYMKKIFCSNIMSGMILSCC